MDNYDPAEVSFVETRREEYEEIAAFSASPTVVITLRAAGKNQ